MSNISISMDHNPFSYRAPGGEKCPTAHRDLVNTSPGGKKSRDKRSCTFTSYSALYLVLKAAQPTLYSAYFKNLQSLPVVSSPKVRVSIRRRKMSNRTRSTCACTTTVVRFVTFFFCIIFGRKCLGYITATSYLKESMCTCLVSIVPYHLLSVRKKKKST